MLENGSFSNCCEAGEPAVRPGWPGAGSARSSGTARPPWVAPALSAVLIVTTAVDVVDNLLVILSVLRNRKLRNAGNLFLVSLASADLAAALYPYPLILAAIFHDGWALAEAHCKASAFVMGLSVIGSVFNITAIAINCCCYVCHSMVYHQICQPWHMPFYICLVSLLTVGALVPNFFMGSLEYDPRVYSCTFIQVASTRYTMAVVVIHFFLPITVMSFCYLRIWALVLQACRRARSDTKLRPKPSDIWSFLTTFVVFVIFAICWAPLNGISLTVAIDPEEIPPQVPEGLFVASYFLAYFNSCLNALVYGLLNQNFHREYKKIVSALWNPRYCVQNASKGSQAPPVGNAQHPVHPQFVELHRVDKKLVSTMGSGCSGEAYSSPPPPPHYHYNNNILGQGTEPSSGKTEEPDGPNDSPVHFSLEFPVSVYFSASSAAPAHSSSLLQPLGALAITSGLQWPVPVSTLALLDHLACLRPPGGKLGKETGMWLAAEIRGLAKSLEYRGWASDPNVEPWQIARAKENLASIHQPESGEKTVEKANGPVLVPFQVTESAVDPGPLAGPPKLYNQNVLV
ncbi:melatonin receptor type 1B [Eumetopias jubatus]|uniref:melatonin receptor type 1B n=1 Tax=Eumetopias jubatus TaxID=34886 RepID=UPI001016B7AF|nr:melatonin receptor type 1B [Eumetopias jubatus]